MGFIDPSCRKRACCSSILVSSNQVLTAYHCFKKCLDLNVKIGDQYSKIINYKKIKNKDIAICSLDKKISSVKPLGFALKSPIKGQVAIITGFGWENKKEDMPISLLRWGISRVKEIDDNGLLILDHSEIDINAWYGDSGGAVLVCEDNNLKIAGVITNANNIAIGVWKECCTLPCTEENVTFSNEQLEKILQKIDNNREVYDILHEEQSPAITENIVKWIKSEKNK